MSRAIILPKALRRTDAEIDCFISHDGRRREFEVIERRAGQTVLDVGTQMWLTFDNDVVELVEEKPEPRKAPEPKPKPVPKKTTSKKK